MKHQQDMQNMNVIPPSSSNKKKKQKNKKKNNKNDDDIGGGYEVYTTLHGYSMIGPFPSGQDVWYCDHKQCQYTQYGVFRKYKIDRWRSSKFGKKFTLCDGCVRQFIRPNPNQQMQKQPSNVNVKININGALPYNYQPGGEMMQQQQPQQYYGMQNQAISPPQAYTQPIQYTQPYVPQYPQ